MLEYHVDIQAGSKVLRLGVGIILIVIGGWISTQLNSNVYYMMDEYGNTGYFYAAALSQIAGWGMCFSLMSKAGLLAWIGRNKRDFTYIDDIVEGVIRVMQGAPEKKNGEDGLPIPPYAVYNIGGGTPENLLDYINTLQEELVRAGVLPEDFDFEAHKKLVGMQPGDVPVTYADSTALERDFGFTPKIGIREGLRKFAQWYKEYYQI